MNAGRTFYCLAVTAGLFTAPALRCQEVPVASVAPARVVEISAPPNAQKQLEPSGLAMLKTQLLMVSDDRDVADVYELKPSPGQTLDATPFLTFFPALGADSSDLEGIALCNDRIYFVEEATTAVVEYRFGGELVMHPLRLPAPRAPGAGLEGIACDAASGILYVAWERQPRMIYALDLSDFHVLDSFDLPAGWPSPRSVDGVDVHADFSDLYFESGFLYALQRSDRTILKIDPAQRRLASRLRLDFSEAAYYDYHEPFGMAEGLVLTRDRIYIVLDNNGVARIGNPQNTAPLFLEFVRPSGF